MQIIVSGSLAYDRIMDFPGKFEDHILPEKLHILNVCFTVQSLSEQFGGTAGNIAYSLALLEEKPLIIATGGKDFDRYEKWLKENGLPTHGIQRVSEVFTAGAYITTDLSDNQITGFNPGAMGVRSEFDFKGFDPQDTLAIISPGNLDDMRHYSRELKKLGIPCIFDPGQSIPALTGEEMIEMITDAEMLISNDYELEMIRNATGMERAAILEHTKAMITTLGEQGAMVVTRSDEEILIPAAAVSEVRDPTGAGDAFRAGLLKGMVMGKSLADSAKIGSVCASYAVEKLGTQEHRFSVEDFWNRYGENFGDADAEGVKETP